MLFKRNPRIYSIKEKRLLECTDRSLKREILFIGSMLLAGMLMILLIIWLFDER